MIRSQWYVVLESAEVHARPVGVTRLGERLVFWRDPSGKVWAAVERCPHRGAALSLGEVQAGHLQCKANLPADAFSHFELVNHLRLPFIEQFERGLSHFEHKRASPVIVEYSGGFHA